MPTVQIDELTNLLPVGGLFPAGGSNRPLASGVVIVWRGARKFADSILELVSRF